MNFLRTVVTAWESNHFVPVKFRRKSWPTTWLLCYDEPFGLQWVDTTDPAMNMLADLLGDDSELSLEADDLRATDWEIVD